MIVNWVATKGCRAGRWELGCKGVAQNASKGSTVRRQDGLHATEGPAATSARPCGWTAVQMHLTQRAVRLDDTMAATPTLPSVGLSAPFSSTSTTRVSYAVRTEGWSKIYTLLYETCTWDSRSSAARPLTSLASACLRLAVLRARVGCVCIEDAVCERCVLGFCVCRGRGKDPVWEVPALRTCVDASNFLQFAFTESVILRFEQDEYESGLMKLHVSQAMVCNTKRHDSNDLKPGMNSQSATLCTMRQDLIDLVLNVK